LTIAVNAGTDPSGWLLDGYGKTGAGVSLLINADDDEFVRVPILSNSGAEVDEGLGMENGRVAANETDFGDELVGCGASLNYLNIGRDG
jgi:hypothetical protein